MAHSIRVEKLCYIWQYFFFHFLFLTTLKDNHYKNNFHITSQYHYHIKCKKRFNAFGSTLHLKSKCHVLTNLVQIKVSFEGFRVQPQAKIQCLTQTFFSLMLKKLVAI